MTAATELPWTVLLHGESGVGKSWLSATAPAPRLIIDAEGRAHFLPGHGKVTWDPHTGPPPAADGSWDTCIVMARSFETVHMAYQWLASGQHQFRSVIIDSLMEVQKRLIDSIAGVAQLKTQDWGEVLRRLESEIRNYRDLATDPYNNLAVAILTCGSINDEGMRRPMLQGQLKATLPYYFDSVGYLYVTQNPDGEVQRALMVQPSQWAVAKDGTNRLPGPVIAAPDLGTLYAQYVGVVHTNGNAPNGGTPTA